MAYPQRLLGRDEQVLLDLHPHWAEVLGPVALIPLVVGVAGFAVAVLPEGSAQGPLRIAVVVLALLLLARVSFWPLLRWQCTSYVITNRRVVIRTGVLSRNGRDIPMSRINDVGFHHSLLERLLRSGTLTVESAGEVGQVVLGNVPQVENVQRTIYQAAEAEEERRRFGDPQPADS